MFSSSDFQLHYFSKHCLSHCKPPSLPNPLLHSQFCSHLIHQQHMTIWSLLFFRNTFFQLALGIPPLLVSPSTLLATPFQLLLQAPPPPLTCPPIMPHIPSLEPVSSPSLHSLDGLVQAYGVYCTNPYLQPNSDPFSQLQTLIVCISSAYTSPLGYLKGLSNINASTLVQVNSISVLDFSRSVFLLSILATLFATQQLEWSF